MTQKEQIKEILSNQDDTTLFYLYNDYIHKINYYDNEIFFGHEIDEILNGKEPSDILMLSYYGDYRPHDNYFMFDGRGNLKSFNYVDEVADIDEIAEYIINSGDCFDIDEIEEILTPETEQ